MIVQFGVVAARCSHNAAPLFQKLICFMFSLILVYNREILLRYGIVKCLECDVKNQIFYIEILNLNCSVSYTICSRYAKK